MMPEPAPSAPDSITAADSAAVTRPPHRKRGFYFWFKWSVRGGVVFVILLAFMIGLDTFFYYPSRVMAGTPKADFGLDFDEVSFPARDGTRLVGWFLPARGVPRGTIVHFHGNAENMSTHILFVQWAPAAGYNLFVFDYRGYGKSAGSVTRAGTISDGHGAIDYVLSRKDVDPGRLFVIGQSLGGAVATVVAAERPEIRALVLDSTFSSYRRIATLHLQKTMMLESPARMLAAGLVSSGYEPIDYITRISPRPVLIIASENDEICYPELSRELFDAAREPKELWIVPGARHTEAFVNAQDEGVRRVAKLFDGAAK